MAKPENVTLAQALTLLETLRVDDMVTVDGTTMRITCGLHRFGGFGSAESAQVNMRIRVGGYSTEVSVGSVMAGFRTIRRATTDEITAFEARQVAYAEETGDNRL